MWYNHRKWSYIHLNDRKGDIVHYLDYHEQIPHKTGDFPLGYYFVDEAFPRYRMPMHWHKEVEIIRILGGKLHLYLDEQELTAEKGDLLTIGGGVIHGGDPENCVYECIVFDPMALSPSIETCRSALKPFARSNAFLKSCTIDADANLKASVDRLFECASNINGRELELLGCIFNFIGAQAKNISSAQLQRLSERTWQKSEQLKPALEYIEQHYGQHISLDTLAKLTGFSPKYFCRYFRAIVHRSPIDYLNYYRVECAAHFLATKDMNVAEVAVHCGFSDSSAFIKLFRKYKGTTPKQYKLHLADGK